MSDMEELYGVFAQECQEQLGALEAGLLQMEQGAIDHETINGVFRAAHTIKGASGVVELAHIERFTHILENLLDQVRNEVLVVTGDMISALLKACDHLGNLLQRVQQGLLDSTPELEIAGEGVALLLLAQQGADAATADMQQAADTSAENAPQDAASALETGARNDCWHISIRFGRGVLRKGLDPLAFLRYLGSLGQIEHITTLLDAMPALDQFDPEDCYIGVEISFRSAADKASIEQVFDFVRDDCALEILPPRSDIHRYIALIENLPEETLRLGEILVRSGALTQEELERGLSQQLPQLNAEQGSAPLGEILVRGGAVQTEIVEAAAAKQKTVADKKAVEARLIRVHADKLDELIDLVGEMVIAGSAANLLANKSGQMALVEATSVLSRLVESIRDSALQLRMVQISETFNRFHRVVRDVSREMGKDIELIITGGETLLDKSVVEKMGDPLMHLIRNALDHGIEPGAVRVAQGKPARGRLQLNAFHDSGCIVIEIVDDGGGLNRARIQAKALERGLIGADEVLTDDAIHALIFEAGFSTAEKVTNISGRGVGMDVVRKNIQALRGTVDVSSTEGQGSKFTIRLPLTLAIIDGFLVGAGRASYVIPLESVVECMELRHANPDRNFLNLRGEVLPFIRLRELFDVPGAPGKRENVVVVKYGNAKAGVVVDTLHGEFQTVIKPLAPLFQHLRGVAGSTILGSGEVALILDIDVITQDAISEEQDKVHAIAAEA